MALGAGRWNRACSIRPAHQPGIALGMEHTQKTDSESVFIWPIILEYQEIL